MSLSKQKRTIIYKFIFLSFFLIFLYFVPKEITYPKHKALNWFIFILVFLILPFIIFNITKSINQEISLIKSLGICALSILIVGPTFGLFQQYREEKELKINGKTTKCIVIDRKKSKNSWLINCQYFVNKREFTTYYHTDEKNKYQIGDTIELVYDKEFPRMYKISF